MHNKRFNKLRKHAQNNDSDGFLVFLNDNIRYLTGLKASGCLFVGEDPFLLVPLLYYDLFKPDFENTITYFQQKIRDDPNLHVGTLYSVLTEQLKSRDVSNVLVDQINRDMSKSLDVQYEASKKIEKMRMIKVLDKVYATSDFRISLPIWNKSVGQYVIVITQNVYYGKIRLAIISTAHCPVCGEVFMEHVLWAWRN